MMIGIFCVSQTILSTFRNIFTIKKRYILSGIFCTLENIVYYLFVSNAIVERDYKTFVVMSIFYGVGTSIGIIINKKMSGLHEALIITSKNVDDILTLKECLKDNKIKFILTDSYSTKDEKNLTIIAFVESKKQKEIIENQQTKLLIELL